MASSEIQDIIDEWKGVYFRPEETPFTDAATSLVAGEPLVNMRPGHNNNRWITYNIATKNVAVLTHAGQWAWDSNLTTGNFVPKGESLPKHVTKAKAHDLISWRCHIPLAFHTAEDDSIYDNLAMMEAHIKTIKEFNPRNRPRKEWQNGETKSSRKSFIFNVQLFNPTTPFESKDFKATASYSLHPWLEKAVEAQKTVKWLPNPNRPRFFEYKDGKFEDLENNNRSASFQRGDIIWMSFMLGFAVTDDWWAPEVLPIELVRVHRSEDDRSKSDYTPYPTVNSTFAKLSSGTSLVPLGAARPLLKTGSASGSASVRNTETQTTQRTYYSDDETWSQLSDESTKEPPVKKCRVAEQDEKIDNPEHHHQPSTTADAKRATRSKIKV